MLEEPGRLMKRKVGSWIKKRRLTQAGMWWVEGERWCTLRTQTVLTVEKVTRTMVNIKYLPRREWTDSERRK